MSMSACVRVPQELLASLAPRNWLERFSAGVVALTARILCLIPTTSSALRAAPPMVVLQAFIKASIEQWESEELLANHGEALVIEVSCGAPARSLSHSRVRCCCLNFVFLGGRGEGVGPQCWNAWHVAFAICLRAACVPCDGLRGFVPHRRPMRMRTTACCWMERAT